MSILNFKTVLTAFFLASSANAQFSSLGHLGKHPTPSKPLSSEKIVEINGTQYDCSDIHRDNDEIAAACAGIEPDATVQNIGSIRVFLTYDEVMARFTPYIESQFDGFIIANTSDKIDANFLLVKPQNILVVKKKNSQLPLFHRDQDGVVMGLNKENATSIDDQSLVPLVIQTSSGANHHMRSFSGIFHVNDSRSKAMNTSYRRTNFNAPMSNALYIGYRYPEGRVSYSAMHGTPPANKRLLGKQRASHGCLRIDPSIAKIIFPAVMSMNGEIPDFNWNLALPELKFQNRSWRFGDSPPNSVKTTKGKKVLFIIFNGHGEAEHTIPGELKSIEI